MAFRRRAGERARLMTEHVETPVGIQFSPTGGLVLHSLSRERVEREVELLARQGLLAPWQGDAAAARTAIEAYAERQALGEPLAAGRTRPQHQTLQALFGDPALHTRDRTLNALRLQQSKKQPLLQSRPLVRLAQLRALDPDLAPSRLSRDEPQFRPVEASDMEPASQPPRSADIAPLSSKPKGMTVADLPAKRAAAKREAAAKRVLHPHEEATMHLLNRERGYTLSPAEHGGKE